MTYGLSAQIDNEDLVEGKLDQYEQFWNHGRTVFENLQPNMSLSDHLPRGFETKLNTLHAQIDAMIKYARQFHCCRDWVLDEFEERLDGMPVEKTGVKYALVPVTAKALFG